MNLFGVGFLELAVIFLIAFLVMGPGKTIEMARSAGKLMGEVRKALNDMTVATNLSGENPADPSSQADPPKPPAAPSQPPQSPPTQAIPTTGPGDGNEQQP